MNGVRANIARHAWNANVRYFATNVQRKPRMELTLRTPYKTVLKDFDGFSRIITKSNEAALVVQNKAPPALYVLPPGYLRIKFNQDVKTTSGDYLHLGGWLTVHLDNTCEVNLLDCFEKKEVRPDQFDRSEVGKDTDTVAGRYVAKLRKTAARVFTKRAGL